MVAVALLERKQGNLAESKQ
ncbi:uncharacterized protein G2W53_019514 [Senna tora]|uniref:Uncharacterized protein n=1 Tax=Senna tora TaxID=362788 RepID=A0A834WM17_9FABA|nr:uncharacterized protein G2W53_019514 [Senna tora]